ncbi:MAG: Na+/H+ antiporter subunit E [Desulfurococcaceae archaeon]
MSVGRWSRAIPVTLLVFVTYIVFSGSATVYDIVTGLVTSVLVGAVTANILLTNASKVFDVKRWAWLIAYALHYFFIDEVKAHVDVIRRILSPRMPINPGIVKVPVKVSSAYGITAVANSITNTPGTVVVDVDEERRCFYVHWIDVKAVEPEECRKVISETFEKYSKRVFD